MKADVDWSKAEYPWNEIGLEWRQSLSDGVELERRAPSRIMSWAKQVKTARENAGHIQWAVATALNAPRGRISEAERGLLGKGHSLWQRLADFYGITLSPP